jgi:hypothetical protein
VVASASTSTSVYHGFAENLLALVTGRGTIADACLKLFKWQCFAQRRNNGKNIKPF